jgi:hypothetical protein
MKIIEIDGLTQERIEREATAEEMAQRQLDEANYVKELEKEAQAKAEAEAKRQAALDKLAALGLEPDDLKALGL